MSGEIRARLRIVGGNDAVVRSVRVSRETRWPPLRVVGEGPLVAPPVPRYAPPPAPMQSAPRRAAWSQAFLAGLVVAMLSSVGQAIAAHL